MNIIRHLTNIIPLQKLFETVLKNGKIPQSVIVFLLAMFASSILIFTSVMQSMFLVLVIWQLVKIA